MRDDELLLACEDEIMATLVAAQIDEVQDVHVSADFEGLLEDEAQGQLPAIGIVTAGLQRLPVESRLGRRIGSKLYRGRASFSLLIELKDESTVGAGRRRAVTISGKVNAALDFKVSGLAEMGRYQFEDFSITGPTESGSRVNLTMRFSIEGEFGRSS